MVDFFKKYWFRLQRWGLDHFARWSSVSDPVHREKFAEILTILAWDLWHVRRHHVEFSLQERLSLNTEQARRVGRNVYKRFFANSLEMASLPFLTRDRLLQRIEAHGTEHFTEALARGRGCIVVSAHYGLWELVPSWMFHNGWPMTIVVRRQSNPEADAWMEFMRQTHGPKTTDSGYGLREILRTLKKGEFLGLMSDQDAGDKGLFVDFLGKKASTVVGPAQIAQKTGAPIVTLVLHPQRHRPHQLEIRPPIFPDRFPRGEAGMMAITCAYADILAEWVRARPEQWFWLHRRWKTRPSEEKCLL